MRTMLVGAALSCALLAGCAVGPKYRRADVPTPPTWKSEAPWRTAAPKDSVPKGAWWELFHDDELNGYETQALAANQALAAAKQRLEQARATARIAAGGLFPQLTANPSAQRSRVSGERPALGGVPPTAPVTQNVFNVPFAVSYETGLFGQVRNNLASANALYQANAAETQNAQLVVTAELAGDYFSLRQLDAEMQVVSQAINYYQKALELVQRRHTGGVASGLDVAQQEAVLDAARTQVELLRQQRSRFEHAIAALVGAPASSFTVPVRPLQAEAPAIPLGVPSDVLERRPDIANAERSMAAANAQIGIAKAAFYPDILLQASGGWQSRDIGMLANASSGFWGIGAQALQTVFNGGRNRAQLQFFKAGYEASVANYRQTVLSAFQDVEDNLSGLDALAKAAQTQAAAVEDSQRALTIANNRYVGGLVTYLDVVNAEETLLNNQRLQSQLLGQRMVTSVFLIKALGGGWDASVLRDVQVRPSLKQAVQP